MGERNLKDRYKAIKRKTETAKTVRILEKVLKHYRTVKKCKDKAAKIQKAWSSRITRKYMTKII